MTITEKFLAVTVIIIVTSAIQAIKIKFPSFFFNFGKGPNEGKFRYNYKFKSKESDEVKKYISEQKHIFKVTFLIELILLIIWIIL